MTYEERIIKMLSEEMTEERAAEMMEKIKRIAFPAEFGCDNCKHFRTEYKGCNSCTRKWSGFEPK
jgi:hypothetical protein